MQLKLSYRFSYAAALLSASYLYVLPMLPLEEEGIGKLGFYLKVLFGFLALLVPLAGYGRIHLRAMMSLAQRFSVTEHDKSRERPLLWMLSLLCGVCLAGWIGYLIHALIPPSQMTAFGILMPGYVGFILSPLNLGELSKPLNKAWSAAVLILIAISFWRCFHFQGHGDAYLYHLALSEIWISTGADGIVSSNIYSGYAGVIEHFYLILKLLGVGNAEQNALAQLCHAFIGWGSFCVAGIYIARRFIPLNLALGLFLLFLQAKVAHAMFLPKNDGFLAASLLMASYALISRQYLYLLSAGCFAFVIKVTAAVGYLALAMVAFLFAPWRKESLKTLFKVFSLCAALMIAMWIPFGLRAYLETSNPLFPVLNNIFHSELAPLSLKNVTSEMSPFSIDMAGILKSFEKFFLFSPLMIAALVLSIVALCLSKTREAVLVSLRKMDFLIAASLCFTSFILLLGFLGPFGQGIEPRHFALPISLALILSLALIYKVLSQFIDAKYVAGLLAVLCIASSNTDSRIIQLKNYWTEDGITRSLLERKPELALNKKLSEIHPNFVRVLALTESNTSYFLKNGEFWHQTHSYPAWKYQFSDMSSEELNQFIREHAISHVYLKDGYFKKPDTTLYRAVTLDRIADIYLYEIDPYALTK